MSRLQIFILVTALTLLAVSPIQEAPVVVYLIGDSTMSHKEQSAYPETGWGTPFATYFEASVTVENHARNGRSTRTFIEEGRWGRIEERLAPGDYVFIQFGHNDEVPTKGSYTTEDEYTTNLVRFVRETRKAGAHPVLLTPVARRQFDEDGRVVGTHTTYAQLVRDVATAERVPLIDMDRQSQDLIQSLGAENSRFLFNHLAPGQNPNYPEGLEDNTHFNEFGARRMAELVLTSIRDLRLGLAEHIVGPAQGR